MSNTGLKNTASKIIKKKLRPFVGRINNQKTRDEITNSILEVDFSDLKKQLAILYKVPEWMLFGEYNPNNDPRDWMFVYNRFIERK